jgi:erythromycin esterase
MTRVITIIIFLTFLSSCKSITVEKKVANEIIRIEDLSNKSSFVFFNNIFSDKDIIILGEASHGDGKSFEIKSNLVEYLIKEKSYNTFAFEGRDFFDIEYINGRKSLNNVFDGVFKENWVRRWSPWGPSKQIENLLSLFSNKSLEPIGFIGLEPCSLKSYSSQKSFEFIKNQLESINYGFYDSKIHDSVSVIREKMILSMDSITSEQFNFYIKSLENYYVKLSEIKNDSEAQFLAQVIENSITSAKIARIDSSVDSDENENERINLRDIQMAKNLIWYKNRNLNSKILVWMANFHGAKKLSEIEFADGDINKYRKFKVFGEHITEYYGDKVFSLAITSSKGKSKMPYNFPGIEEIVIKAPMNSLESELELKNIEFGYIDFNKIQKKKNSLSDNKFNSIMLGYYNQNGKWIKVFDALLYIRENNIAISIE